MSVSEIYEEWKNKTVNDESLYKELTEISGDEKAIEDRFYKDLAFGTGGLRGKLGAGTNRMNIYSVGRATFGLCDYILAHGGKSIGIAFDSRNMSSEFARIVAEIMSFRGIKAYLFDRLMPTPVLSYTVRKFSLSCGVVITASHNPKEYNGYKVYNSRGCQLTDNDANEVTENIKKYGYFNEYKANESLIKIIGEEVLDDFIKEVLTYSLTYDKKYLPSIVYSPLCGTGNIPVQKLFSKLGVENYTIVPEQKEPDGNFTTCPFPNPEEKSALTLALKCAKEKNAELVIATDPDADRVGIAVRDNNGEYVLLNGNETGILMENFILSKKKEAGDIPDNAYIVKTIVTSDLATKVAEYYNVNVKDVLTGFKYIGETIDKCDKEKYLFGMEESYGYLCGTHVRDKDSISAVMMIVESYCYYKSIGQNMLTALESLYNKFGYFTSGLISKVFEGKSGMEYMAKFTKGLREKPFSEIAGEKVEKITDFIGGINGLPKSDVIKFEGERFSLIVRPSGTEPKLKLYVTAKEETKEKSLALRDTICKFIEEIF